MSGSSWGKKVEIINDYEESESDSDSDSDSVVSNRESKFQVEKIDLDFPTINQSIMLTVVKQNTELSDGWKTVNNKTKIVQILSDPLKIGKHLQKTQMCESIKKNFPCRHGKSCRFAHIPEELVIGECVYGDNCRFVTCINNTFSNFGDKICNRRHSTEQIEEYYIRTGLKKRGLATDEEMQAAFDDSCKPIIKVKPEKFKSFVFRKFENVQNKPKKAAIIDSPRKFISDSLEVQKIKEKNEIAIRKSEIIISIDRKQETIDRTKKMNPLPVFYKTQIKKLETEIIEYKKELLSLNDKLKAVATMKKIEVVQSISMTESIVEQKKEVSIVSKKVVNIDSPILSISSNKKVENKPIVVKLIEIKPIEVDKPKTLIKTVINYDVQKFVKTQMCTFGKDCKRGNACRFAHSKEELVVSNCTFGNNCRFVTRTSRGFENVNKEKICTRRHVEEHINNYYYRVGIDKIAVRTIMKTIIVPVIKSSLKLSTQSWSNIAKK